MSSPRQEESAQDAQDAQDHPGRPRKRERALARMQTAGRKAREQQARTTRAQIIRAELERRPECRCGIRPSMTVAELQELGEGCTGDRWICPCLDAIRRRLGK